jgi:hypothetical protein
MEKYYQSQFTGEEIDAKLDSLKDYLIKEEAEDTYAKLDSLKDYLTKEEAEDTYAKKTTNIQADFNQNDET